MESPESVVCYRCGITFTPSWSNTEALAELQKNFPGAKIRDCHVVCDDCYHHIMPAIKN